MRVSFLPHHVKPFDARVLSRARTLARPWLIVASIAGLAGSASGQAPAAVFRIDPDQSRLVVEVGKSGLFSFLAGHSHEVVTSAVGGVVRVNAADLAQSSVDVTVDAASLRVTGKGEPKDDVPNVQERMLGEQVLDVARYPTIALHGTAVAVKSRSSQGDRILADVVVSGTFTLRDRTRPIEIPVHLELDPDALTATGQFTVKQTDYGIKPISVAGVVTVKDAVSVSFTVVARQ